MGAMGSITGNVTGGNAEKAYGVFIASNQDTAIDIDGALACGPTGTVPFVGRMRLVKNVANTITMINTDDVAVEYSFVGGPSIIGGKVVRR